jgi:hypothetical protein
MIVLVDKIKEYAEWLNKTPTTTGYCILILIIVPMISENLLAGITQRINTEFIADSYSSIKRSE